MNLKIYFSDGTTSWLTGVRAVYYGKVYLTVIHTAGAQRHRKSLISDIQINL